MTITAIADAMTLVVCVLFGLALGSFLNVCIDRLPAGQSLVRPPSHCSNCGHRLGFRDLIPIVSFVWLRGRCRYCRCRLPVRLPMVEGLMGALLGLLYWRFGLTLQFGLAVVYTWILAALFFIDLERQLVPNKLVYPGMAIALAFSFFWPDLGVLRALLGGVAGGGIMFVVYVLSRGGIGIGDIKLMTLLGLALGFPYILIALLLAVVGGGLVAASLLISGIKKRRDAIPFAPFLVSGAFVILLWGQPLYNWYVGLLFGGLR